MSLIFVFFFNFAGKHFDMWVIPCQLDKLMSPWVENFKIDIFRGFYI
jgi:hypothetical protein